MSADPNAALPVAIIGAGIGGIAAAWTLRRAGFDIVVFEASEGIGGTWWDNRYPGAATDAASVLYSYSWAPHDWTRTHVGHAELRGYLEHVVDRFGLRSAIRLGTRVRSVAWQDELQAWRLTTESGQSRLFRAVVSAVGFLTQPRWPDWQSPGSFKGAVVHSARWPADLDLRGRRVAVVGTGSSAAQVVPALAPEVDHLTLFQRQPGWLLPKGDRDLGAFERRMLRFSPYRRLVRQRRYWAQEIREWNGAFFKPGQRSNTVAREAALAYLDQVFHDRPDLKAALTPDYPFAGKRAVISSEFFPALRRPNVTLVPRAVEAWTERGLRDSAGVEHAVDAVVLCTGFEATAYLSSLDVVGRHGRSLAQTWDGVPSAFLGVMMPGFPNFFMLYGPNTNGGLIVSNLERQARFAARELQRLRRRGLAAVEVSEDAHTRYNAWLQGRMAGTAFVDVSNYYKAASGRVVTQWPDNATQYAARLALTRRFGRWRLPQQKLAQRRDEVDDGIGARTREVEA